MLKEDKIISLHTKEQRKRFIIHFKCYNYNKVIIHWYSGPLDILEKFINLGCYFTISVDIGYSKFTEKILKHIPIDKLLSETDGPTALEWVSGVYGYPSEIKKLLNDSSSKISEEELINDNYDKLNKTIRQ